MKSFFCKRTFLLCKGTVNFVNSQKINIFCYFPSPQERNFPPYGNAVKIRICWTCDRTKLEKFLLPSGDRKAVTKLFVRDSSLSLTRLLLFMIMPRGELPEQTVPFYDGMGLEPPTKSVFSIGPKFISPAIFHLPARGVARCVLLPEV